MQPNVDPVVQPFCSSTFHPYFCHTLPYCSIFFKFHCLNMGKQHKSGIIILNQIYLGVMFSNVFHKFIQPCSAPPRNLYEHMTLWCNVSHKCFNLLTNLTKQKNNPCHYIAWQSSGKSLLGHSDYSYLVCILPYRLFPQKWPQAMYFWWQKLANSKLNMFGPIAI